MFKTLLGGIAAPIISATTAAAVPAVLDAFDSPLNAGDATSAVAQAGAGEDFGNLSLFFGAAEDLIADVIVTINPYNIVGGVAANTIEISYSVDGGATTLLPITPSTGAGTSELSFGLLAAETATFFLNGEAGPTGNIVTFSVTTAAAVPVAPAGVMLLTALGALALRRRAA